MGYGIFRFRKKKTQENSYRKTIQYESTYKKLVHRNAIKDNLRQNLQKRQTLFSEHSKVPTNQAI